MKQLACCTFLVLFITTAQTGCQSARNLFARSKTEPAHSPEDLRQLAERSARNSVSDPFTPGRQPDRMIASGRTTLQAGGRAEDRAPAEPQFDDEPPPGKVTLGGGAWRPRQPHHPHRTWTAAKPR